MSETPESTAVRSSDRQRLKSQAVVTKGTTASTPSKRAELGKATVPERPKGSKKQADSQAEIPAFTAESLEELHAKQRISIASMLTEQQKDFDDFVMKFEQKLHRQVTKLVEEQVRERLAPVLEQNRDMQARITQLEERIESSQHCSSSHTACEATPDRHWASVASSTGQLEKHVSRLTECKMQEQDKADQEARNKRELNAVLRNFAQEEGETPESLKDQVDKLLAEQLNINVVCPGAKRQQKSRNDTAPGIVVVQFERKQQKIAVFKARGKLASTLAWMTT